LGKSKKRVKKYGYNFEVGDGKSHDKTRRLRFDRKIAIKFSFCGDQNV
jgi:hypothetical protein